MGSHGLPLKDFPSYPYRSIKRGDREPTLGRKIFLEFRDSPGIECHSYNVKAHGGLHVCHLGDPFDTGPEQITLQKQHVALSVCGGYHPVHLHHKIRHLRFGVGACFFHEVVNPRRREHDSFKSHNAGSTDF